MKLIKGGGENERTLLGIFASKSGAERRAAAFSEQAALRSKVTGAAGAWAIHVVDSGPAVSSEWTAFVAWADVCRERRRYQMMDESSEFDSISGALLSNILGSDIFEYGKRREDYPRLYQRAGLNEENHLSRFVRIRCSGPLSIDTETVLLDLRNLIFFAETHMPGASARTALYSAIYVLAGLGFELDARDLRLDAIGDQAGNLLVNLDEELAENIRTISEGPIEEVGEFASYRDAFIDLAMDHDRGVVCAGSGGWKIFGRPPGLLGSRSVRPPLIDQWCSAGGESLGSGDAVCTDDPGAEEAWPDKPFEVTLSCGTTVAVVAVEYQRTYAGLIEGKPGQKVNDRILDELRKSPSPWGQRKHHFIEPLVDWGQGRQPRLPPIRLSAWLISNRPLDSRYCASESVVSWLTDECHFDQMAKVVARGVRGLHWRTVAADFDY